MNIGVLGAGSWAVALAVLLNKREHVVSLWEYSAPEAFNKAFGTHIRGDEFETIGGFVVTQLDHFPELGEVVQVNGHTLKVTELDGLRIVTLEVRTSGMSRQA